MCGTLRQHSVDWSSRIWLVVALKLPCHTLTRPPQWWNLLFGLLLTLKLAWTSFTVLSQTFLPVRETILIKRCNYTLVISIETDQNCFSNWWKSLTKHRYLIPKLFSKHSKVKIHIRLWMCTPYGTYFVLFGSLFIFLLHHTFVQVWKPLLVCNTFQQTHLVTEFWKFFFQTIYKHQVLRWQTGNKCKSTHRRDLMVTWSVIAVEVI